MRRFTPCSCPLDTIGLRANNTLPSTPAELDAAVAAVAVATDVYLIKFKTMHRSWWQSSARPKVAPNATARHRVELRERIAFELEEMDEEMEVTSLWKRPLRDRLAKVYVVGVVACPAQARRSTPSESREEGHDSFGATIEKEKEEVMGRVLRRLQVARRR